jgi:hypothetical protein
MVRTRTRMQREVTLLHAPLGRMLLGSACDMALWLAQVARDFLPL